MDAEARSKILEQARKGALNVDPELTAPIEKLSRKEMLDRARTGQLDSSQVDTRPSLLDWVKQPVYAVSKGVNDLANLATSGGAWLTQVDEPKTELDKVLYAGPSVTKGVSSALRKGAEITGAASKGLDENRPIPKGVNPHADAFFTLAEWGHPLKIPKKLKDFDWGMGTLAALGERAFGEGGENLAFAAPAKSFATALPGAVRKAASKLSDQELKEMGGWLSDQFHDKISGIRKLREAVAEGVKGDIADLSQDVGAANVIKGIRPGSQAAVSLHGAAKARASDTAREVEQAFYPGDPKAAQDTARLNLARQQQEARLGVYGQESALQDQAIQARTALLNDPESVPSLLPGSRAQLQRTEIESSLAREQAASQSAEASIPSLQQASMAVKPPAESVTERILTPGETSAAMAKTISDADRQLKAEFVDKAWDDFDKSGNFQLNKNVHKIFEDTLISGVKDNFRGSARGDVVQFMKREMQGLKALDTRAVRPIDLQSISSLMDSLINFVPKREETYRAAKETFIQSRKAVGDKPVTEAMRVTQAKPEALGKNLFVQGPEGAANARSMLETLDQKEMAQPQMLKAMEDHILSRLDNELSTSDDGTSFLTKYDEFLNEWGKRRPEFTQKIRDYVDTQQVMNSKLLSLDATKEQEQALRSKMVDEWQASESIRLKEKGKRVQSALAKSQLNQYTKKPKDTIKKALLSEDSEAFSRLANSFRGPQKVNFSAQVGEVVKELTRKGDLTTDIESFNRLRKRLKQVMGPKGFESFKRLEQEAQWQELKSLASGVKFKGGQLETKTINDLAETASVLAVLSATKGVSNPLVAGGLARRIIRRAFRGPAKLREHEANQFLEQLVTDPRAFLKAIDGASSSPSKINDFADKYVEKLRDKKVPARLFRATALQDDEGE